MLVNIFEVFFFDWFCLLFLDMNDVSYEVIVLIIFNDVDLCVFIILLFFFEEDFKYIVVYFKIK